MDIREIKHHIHSANNPDAIKKIHSDILSIVAIKTPTYYPFEQSSPNFLKINNLHPKSVIPGNFIQYNFFPWNAESESFFNTLKNEIGLLIEYTDTYCRNEYLKSYLQLTGLNEKNLYNDTFFFRLAYQCFPLNNGFLSLHRDPTGEHQICAPILNLSPKKESGLYYILDDECHCIQPQLNYGDTVFFDSSRLHGVFNDLVYPFGTEHILISVHSYHNQNAFKNSYLTR